MSKRLLVLIVIILIKLSLPAQDFYDINTINELELIFEEDNWNNILQYNYDQGEEERLIGTAIINGVQYDSVGVRYKGSSSCSGTETKKPFNIKLDHVIDDQLIEGYGTLKLANGWRDPSFIRETLSYEIAAKYMPASKANFMKVTVNEEYIGVYTSVQSVDKYYLESHFGSNDNPFFKGELEDDDLFTITVVWDYLGLNPDDYLPFYEMKSDEGWEELISFLDDFNNNPESMNNILNVDMHLWMLAYDNLFVNLDSPINFAHNYYLYQTGDGRFNPIIWDFNQNFGSFPLLIGGVAPPFLIDELQQLDPFLNETNPNYPIITKVMENPVNRTRYIAHMKTIINENILNGWYETRAYELQDIIGEEIENDPNLLYTYEEFLQNVETAVYMGPMPLIGITQLMDARADYIMNFNDFTAAQPQFNHYELIPANPVSGEELLINMQIDDAESAYVCWRTLADDKFNETEIFDDGQHGDGAADDGLFANTIVPQGEIIEYYFVADNSTASAFDPARAAYEFYSQQLIFIPVGDVAINELMADNDGYIEDEMGEYDDWFELYNLLDTEIDISGYYLSDDASEPDKWQVPEGVIIPENGFICFWADDDEEQGDLHTNFKLSASGETLVLSDTSGNIVDQVTYPAQDTDISYGRYPDGTGRFVYMEGSYMAANTGNINSEINEIFPIEHITNYPNPFNPSTIICFDLMKDSFTTLNIYNAKGQLVKELFAKNLSAGRKEILWDGKDKYGNFAASGIYLYHLKSDNYSASGKMVMMK